MADVNFIKRNSERYGKWFQKPEFQEVYKKRRYKLYRKIVRLIQEYPCSTVLDIGCAYGQVVEMCRDAGMAAYGFDLPIPELVNQPKPDSMRQAFVYGNVELGDLSQLPAVNWHLVCLIDTLRFLSDVSSVNQLKPRYFLIKDSCRGKRLRAQTRVGVAIPTYSLDKLLEHFGDYEFHTLFTSRFLFRFRRPGRMTIWLVNKIFPTYIAVLQRKG